MRSRHLCIPNCWKLCAAILTLAIAVPLLAQYRSTAPRKKNPRAVAVVQVLPGGGARLMPVSIFLDGKFYDARYYMAKPVPLSLYDQTVYEALQDGLPVGEFTVHLMRSTPKMLWGEGKWKPTPTASDSDKDGKASGNSGAKDDDRPVLKKPGDKKEAKPTAGNEGDAGFKPDDDPDRPTLKKPKPNEAPQVAITAKDLEMPQPADDDPDRPILKREQPEPTANKPETVTAPQTGIPGAKYYVAISDADPLGNRPYDYRWSDSEKAKWTEQLSKMAMDAVRKLVTSGDSRAQLLPDAKFAETQLRAFDLDYSNSPYMIFTGRIDPAVQPPSTRPQQGTLPQLATFYVTLVARVNSDGNLTRLMTVATDSAHLDLHSRYELIDAVDADGDKRAELLFRRITDLGNSYVLYRMSPFQMTKVFEGGSGL